MENLFIEYPKCSTCQKAKSWLEENGIEFTDRHILENTPTEKELAEWIAKSGMEIKSFFNTSGIKYRELKIAEKLSNMTQEEQIRLLASEGMLIKRPLFISEEAVLVGFREKDWQILKSKKEG